MKKILKSFLPIVLVLISIFIVLLLIEFKVSLEASKVYTIHIAAQENAQVIDDEDLESVDVDLATNKLFLEAKAWMKEEKYVKAEKAYSKLLLDYPSAQMYNRLGVLYAKQGFVEKAKKAYKNALKYNKRYYRSYFNLGILYKNLKNYKKAKDFYNQSIVLHPYHFKSHLYLGSVLEKMGQNEKAIAIYKKVLKLSNGTNKAKVLYALAHLSKDDAYKAKMYLKASIRLEPTSLKARLALLDFEEDVIKKEKDLLTLIELHPSEFKPVWVLGKYYKKMKLYDKALMLYSNFLQNIPNDKEALYESAQVDILMKKYPDAISNLKALIALYPENDKYQVKLIRLYKKAGLFEKALALADKILQKNNDFLELLEIKASIFKEEGRKKELRNLIKKILKFYPKHHKSYYYLAEMELMQKHFKLSEAKIDKAIALKPESDYYVLKASIFKEKKAWLLSIKFYQKALSMDDKNYKAYAGAIKTSINAKLYKQALVFAKDYKRVRPNSFDSGLLLAKAFYRLKEYEASSKQLEALLLKYPQNFKLLYQKAKILSKTRRNEESSQVLASLVDRYPTNITLRYNYAKSLKKSVQYKIALKEVNKILQLLPEHKLALKLKKKIEIKLKGKI